MSRISYIYCFFIVVLAISTASCSGKHGDQKALEGIASYINTQCPQVYDQFVRLDSCSVLPGKVFRYNYTLNLNKMGTTAAEFEERMKPFLKNGLKVSPDDRLVRMKEMEATFSYLYKDSTGNIICNIMIAPDDYNIKIKK